MIFHLDGVNHMYALMFKDVPKFFWDSFADILLQYTIYNVAPF